MSSEGRMDGEVSRVFSIGERFKTSLRVNVPFLSLNGAAFAIDPKVKLSTASDLAHYISGILSGVLYSEKLTEGHPRIYGDTLSQLIRQMVAGRSDLMVVTGISGRLEVENHFPDAGIRLVHEALVRILVYHYLNKKNRHIIPLITPVLAQMHQSGEIMRMKASFIRERVH